MPGAHWMPEIVTVFVFVPAGMYAETKLLNGVRSPPASSAAKAHQTFWPPAIAP